MRKRRFRREIPDQLLPGGRVAATPVPAPDPVRRERAAENNVAPKDTAMIAPILTPRSSAGRPTKKASLRTKRLVALCIVILVSASIPVLALSLVLAG